MAIDYPDIISEYVDATERYETDGVQIVPYLEQPEIQIGGITNLALFLQSAVDVPVKLTLRPDLPQTSRFRGTPMLAVGQQELSVALEPAQVGVLFVPVATTARAKEGRHQLHLNVLVNTEGQPTRVRYAETGGRLQSELIDDVVGLDLARIVGVPYKTTPTDKISISLAVRGKAVSPDEAPKLDTRFQVLWSREDATGQVAALQEVSQRRAIIVDQLQVEPLYVALLVEGQRRFADAGLPLRVGEAVALAKILTYTFRHFMANGDLQDGLLVPMWELANEYDLPSTDPLWVVRNVGFHHLLRLSVAVSFGLVRQALGHHAWNVEERRAVIALISDAVEARQPLPPEFLYIPLLLAAITISPQVVMDGEDNANSLMLLQKAKAKRAKVFADPDLADANQIFERLMNAALQT